jgi:hypothetical protein
MSKNDGQPRTIFADNISDGWVQAMRALMKPGVTRVSPMTLIVRGLGADGTPIEVPQIRNAVDKFLEAQGNREVENVAWTIFPQRYWQIADGDRDLFFETFIESFQRVQDFNPRNNKRGSYFQRLVDLNGGGKGPNQLDWIIRQYNEHPDSRRASKFQATTFDPARDFTSAGQLEFPCLQQVSFTVQDGGLHLNGFYATQQIARKGYGNYLGLARLGAFMASQMGLKFEQLNVFVGIAKMDAGKTDSDVVELMKALEPAQGASTVLEPA